MNKLNKLLVLGLFALVAGCGGGGGGGSSDTSNPPSTQTPTAGTVTDPLTNTTAPGTATTSLSGTSYKNATIRAYNVQPDGSNGSLLGGPVVSDAQGAFTLTMTSAPTGMVRLVSTGGTYMPADVDAKLQTAKTLELVAPFVTTSYNTFKITPVTHVASHVLAFKAKNGATLASAFKTGMQAVLAIDSANIFVMNDTSLYLNLLSGNLRSNTQSTPGLSVDAREMINAFDWFGVQFDLPTSTVARIVAAVAEGNYPTTNVDGVGADVNVGQWSGTVFDETTVRTLASVMGGVSVSQYINMYLIMDFAVETACDTGWTAQLTNRYPFYPLDGSGKVPASECTDVKNRLNALRARIATNTRSSAS